MNTNELLTANSFYFLPFLHTKKLPTGKCSQRDDVSFRRVVQRLCVNTSYL